MSGLPLYRRALKQPEHARRALEIARNEGLVRTYRRIRGQLAAGLPTGYSAAGTVVAVGEEVDGYAAGDRVACAGAGIANHAELIDVPVNLCVPVPDGLGLDAASTATLGAIALQGVRRAEPTLGEAVGVIGLGILGQLTVQFLRANGCRALGTDPDGARVALALAHGAEDASGDFAARCAALTDGFGADVVIVTAATASSEPMHIAAQACRRKGRIVIVGDVGLELRRADLYEKELDVRMSTSYGPGRYDPVYEVEGQDYPIAHVRWTENRNMSEYLRLLGDGSVRLDGLPQERFEVDEVEAAYSSLGERKPLLVLLSYPERREQTRRTIHLRTVEPRPGVIRVGLVGAGGFAQGTHVPNLLKLRDRFAIRAVMSRTGSTAKAVAARAEAAYATTDLDEILADPEIDLVLVATRHDLHARQAIAALRAGKNVFVEKPTALNEDELSELETFFAENGNAPVMMTGFNRRFAPSIARARTLLAGRTTPIVADYRMNAGYIPLDHWVHGPEGGGRNVGEACHVYDLFDSLVGGAEVEDVTAQAIRADGRRLTASDNFAATIRYADGSVCTLTYTALGHREHPKERLEIFADNRVISLDDYKTLTVTGARDSRSSRQRKGHVEELEALAKTLREGGPWPISLEEQARAMRIAFAVEEAIAGGRSG
jgi:predicted dehydrogenase/threonine dehydrogenase-like Zn-dependent dehydrogenase